MAKVKENCPFDAFAWLIHREVEQYLAEHNEDYNIWAQEHNGSDDHQRKEAA